jgi:hypothetical protein
MLKDYEPSRPPGKTEVGQVYYVRWGDGSENLFLMEDEYQYRPIAGEGDAEFLVNLDTGPFNPNWSLVKECRLVPPRDLPLYVSWRVNRYFTELIQ